MGNSKNLFCPHQIRGTSKNCFEKRKCGSRVEDEERLRKFAGLSVSPSVSQARHLPAAGEATQGEET